LSLLKSFTARNDKPNRNDEPDYRQQENRANNLIAREPHGLLFCSCRRYLGKLVFKCASIRMTIRRLKCTYGRLVKRLLLISAITIRHRASGKIGRCAAQRR